MDVFIGYNWLIYLMILKFNVLVYFVKFIGFIFFFWMGIWIDYCVKENLILLIGIVFFIMVVFEVLMFFFWVFL